MIDLRGVSKRCKCRSKCGGMRHIKFPCYHLIARAGGGDPSNPPPPDTPLHLRDSAHSFILHISRVISMRSYVSDHNVTRHQAENIFK